MIAAQGGFAAGGKLRDAKWLDDIIVGPSFEEKDFEVLVGLNRQHDDRYVGPRADRLKDLKPVRIRETKVEDDHVGLGMRGGSQACSRGIGLVDPISVKRQPGNNETPDLGFVVDDENGIS